MVALLEERGSFSDQRSGQRVHSEWTLAVGVRGFLSFPDDVPDDVNQSSEKAVWIQIPLRTITAHKFQYIDLYTVYTPNISK